MYSDIYVALIGDRIQHKYISQPNSTELISRRQKRPGVRSSLPTTIHLNKERRQTMARNTGGMWPNHSEPKYGTHEEQNNPLGLDWILKVKNPIIECFLLNSSERRDPDPLANLA